jgi:hypothetical protein
MGGRTGRYEIEVNFVIAAAEIHLSFISGTKVYLHYAPSG